MIFSYLPRLSGLLLVLLFTLAGCITSKKEVGRPIAHLYSVRDPQFQRSMEALLGPALVGGNRTVTLLNGVQIFPSMLAAIHGARESINFETYIYSRGQAGDTFAEALAERARAGVKVRVILDWVGALKTSAAEKETMREAGVEIVNYHPPRWSDPLNLNNRTHRKLLVVDGKIGFIGGVGIDDHWQGNADAPGHWRDTQYRVTGPVVAQMQSDFMDNWMKSRGELLHGDSVLPELGRTGGETAQAFRSSPGLGGTAIRSMYLLSIASASRSIHIETPYFVPDDLFLQELVAARRRGVRVQIIVPGQHIDAKITRRASRSHWGSLLEAGVEFYEYQPTMFHAKLMVVDGYWCSVGSANLDNRSFRLNDEANLNVLDAGFAGRQLAVFAQDKTRARRISPEEWRRRSLYEKNTTPLRETFEAEL